MILVAVNLEALLVLSFISFLFTLGIYALIRLIVSNENNIEDVMMSTKVIGFLCEFWHYGVDNNILNLCFCSYSVDYFHATV